LDLTECIVGVSVAPSELAGQPQRSVGTPPDEAITSLRFSAVIILVTGPLQAQAPAIVAVLGMGDFVENNDVGGQGLSMRQMYNIFNIVVFPN
jgi:hypothetical protein